MNTYTSLQTEKATRLQTEKATSVYIKKMEKKDKNSVIVGVINVFYNGECVDLNKYIEVLTKLKLRKYDSDIIFKKTNGIYLNGYIITPIFNYFLSCFDYYFCYNECNYKMSVEKIIMEYNLIMFKSDLIVENNSFKPNNHKPPYELLINDSKIEVDSIDEIYRNVSYYKDETIPRVLCYEVDLSLCKKIKINLLGIPLLSNNKLLGILIEHDNNTDKYVFLSNRVIYMALNNMVFNTTIKYDIAKTGALIKEDVYDLKKNDIILMCNNNNVKDGKIYCKKLKSTLPFDVYINMKNTLEFNILRENEIMSINMKNMNDDRYKNFAENFEPRIKEIGEHVIIGHAYLLFEILGNNNMCMDINDVMDLYFNEPYKYILELKIKKKDFIEIIKTLKKRLKNRDRSEFEIDNKQFDFILHKQTDTIMLPQTKTVAHKQTNTIMHPQN